MIHFCACTKSSQSSLENPKSRDSCKFCKSCSGRLPVDGPGAQSVSMLSTVGLELPRLIDPHLTWKTASKGRQRAVRRARTSFTCANIMKAPSRSLKGSEDLVDNGAKNTRDMPVSESEKVGVSILGRRFSESLESVPIKKRRFLLVRSPSPPPHHLTSYSDDVNRFLEDQPALYQDTGVNQKRLPDTKTNFRGKNSADGKTDPEELIEKSCDAADFSGISILAAAACDGNIGGDSLISEASVSKEYSSGGQNIARNSSQLHFLTEEKEELLPRSSEASVSRTGVSSSELPSKEANDVKSDGSCNLRMSMNSSHKVPKKTTESVSRDARFPWDLNTLMDVWESHDDEVLNSEPQCTSENYGKVETCEKQEGFHDTKNNSGAGECKVNLVGEGKGVCGFEKLRMEETPGISGDHSAAGDRESKACFSFPHEDAPSSDGHHSDVLISMAYVSEETKSSYYANRNCTVSGDFLASVGGALASVGGALVSVGDSSLSAPALEEEKAEQHCKSLYSEVETDNSSYMVSCENSIQRNTSAFEPHHGLDEGFIEATSVEEKNVASGAEQENHSDNCCTTDVQMTLVTDTRSIQGEKELLCIDSGTVRTASRSFSSHLAERIPKVLVDGNICGTVVTADASCGENMHSSSLNETNCADADKMGGKTILCYAVCEKTDAEVIVGTKAEEMRVDATNGEKQVDSTDVEIDGVICNQLTSENLNGTKNELPDQVLHSKSTVRPLGSDNAPLEDGSSGSQRIFRNYADASAINPGQLASEDHLDCDYYSDASQNDADRTIGMEKVEFLADDDSQYEDGEFRQPIADCWLEDGAEDGEVERVDYGSDEETNVYGAAADFSSSANQQVNNEGLPDASVRIPYGTHVGKDTQHPISPSVLNCPPIADSLSGKKNIGSVAESGLRGHNRTEDGSKQLVNDVKVASKFYAASYKVIGNNGFNNGGHGDGLLGHITSSRMKMSGWDQLPGGRNSENGQAEPRVAPISRNHTGASLDTSVSSESVRRVVGPLMMRDLSSRMEKAQSSDGSQRKDKPCIRTSRSNDHDFNSQVEADAGAPRSIGRSGSSLHLQGRGRGEQWVDSLKHHGNGRHDSSGYYCHASFSHPGSRNAAAAAVAKVESNGFVVAPDGTIVKASALGSSGLRARGSGNASSQSNHQPPMGRGSLIERDRPYGMPPIRGRSRGMSPDMSMPVGRARAGRYGPGMVKIGCRERYRAPISDDIIDSPCHVSRREHSFSPRRRPFHLSRSHSRSPSRSRTRSPPRWASPRLRNDGRMNNGPAGFRRNSNSPNFNSETTIVRQRPIFRERITLSRNHTSPPHSSRWIDGRKEHPEHFRGHEYRRCSPRVFSRGQKYELMDSPGRPKQSEFYQRISSGKFAEFGFNRGSRHEGRGDDRRGHGDRYEMHHSVRQYNDDDNMKRFHYGGEDGFRIHNPQPKSSDYPQEESPRAFDRNVERQLDSPWRFKEDKGQCGENRDGKNNASFMSFVAGEDDDHMDARKRRPS